MPNGREARQQMKKLDKPELCDIEPPEVDTQLGEKRAKILRRLFAMHPGTKQEFLQQHKKGPAERVLTKRHLEVVYKYYPTLSTAEEVMRVPDAKRETYDVRLPLICLDKDFKPFIFVVPKAMQLAWREKGDGYQNDVTLALRNSLRVLPLSIYTMDNRHRGKEEFFRHESKSHFVENKMYGQAHYGFTVPQGMASPLVSSFDSMDKHFGAQRKDWKNKLNFTLYAVQATANVFHRVVDNPQWKTQVRKMNVINRANRICELGGEEVAHGFRAVIHNLPSSAHRDKKDLGFTWSMSFGDFTGGNMVFEDIGLSVCNEAGREGRVRENAWEERAKVADQLETENHRRKTCNNITGRGWSSISFGPKCSCVGKQRQEQSQEPSPLQGLISFTEDYRSIPRESRCFDEPGPKFRETPRSALIPPKKRYGCSKSTHVVSDERRVRDQVFESVSISQGTCVNIDDTRVYILWRGKWSTPYTPLEYYKDARKFVREQFGPVTYDNLLDYFKLVGDDRLRLWGDERSDLLLEANMVVYLYHDLKGHCWSRIERGHSLDYPFLQPSGPEEVLMLCRRLLGLAELNWRSLRAAICSDPVISSRNLIFP
ncbi:hypothetical protein PROFUN_12528 [Planoprotostelium fungivorum]|uniref:Uncharacterized protein n=1 Tax=Planoprotostelium fungivorum TaxID=1890364 RepID=A0A2P6MS42_9EUKA|nr:hypothetical protein PROFUN_12528 [Planoprotostelium fungivorum]